MSSDNARSVGGLNAVTRGTRLDDTDQSLAGELAGPGLVLSAERPPGAVDPQRARRRRRTTPSDRPSSISGVANLGTSATSPTGRDLDVLQIADTVALQRGAHVLKAGADLLYNRVTILFPGALQGSYTFTSLSNLQRGVYQQYQQAFGEPSMFQSNPNLGVFVQDEWSVGSGLTLNAGLRYDLQWLPDPVALDVDNLSPRVGLAWATPIDEPWCGRAAACSSTEYRSAPRRTPSSATACAIRWPCCRSVRRGRLCSRPCCRRFPSNTVSAITTIDPAIQNGRSEQFGLQVERAARTGHVGGRRAIRACGAIGSSCRATSTCLR